VGIDGSQAAITAALWGVNEAISRGVPLRLVSVIKLTHPSPDDYARDLEHAETSLRQAQSAVEASGKPVKIETGIPRGPAGPVLVEASRDVEMICVRSVGIGRYARSIMGSAATELAEKAHCPVAVLRTERTQPPPDINWIVVRMTDEPDNDAVLKYAAWEAKLRRAPMLVLGGRPEELTALGAGPSSAAGTNRVAQRILNSAPSLPHDPNGGCSPRSIARMLGRPMCAKTSRRTPARRATAATSRTHACPPTPRAKRIGLFHPAASANINSTPAAHSGKVQNSGAQAARWCTVSMRYP
jgi:nucleotide-binding universal stress UspA family protein